jgi:hypothetical protein
MELVWNLDHRLLDDAPGRLGIDTEPLILYSNAAWLLYDFDLQTRRAVLLKLQENDYHEASFLDQRIEPRATGRHVIDLPDIGKKLLNLNSPTTNPHYIFHLGHCGSTLLSRALSASPNVFPIREPLTLRRLADGFESERKSLLETSLSAHARVFHPGQTPVIKATSTCNKLIHPILSMNESSRAILMYVSLETYLAGMLGKQSPPLDLRGHAKMRLAHWNEMDSAPPLDLSQLDTSQLAVLAWLTGMHQLVKANFQFPDQTLLLDFEQFLSNPETGLKQTVNFLGFTEESELILEAWPDISTGYSKKPDEPYSRFNRRKTLLRGLQNHADEIRQGMEDAENLINTVEELQACRPYLRD